MKKNIMILGANSIVAKELIRYLQTKYNLFLVLNDKNKFNNKNLQNIKLLTFKDITKFKKIKFDILINCIAKHQFSKNRSIIDYINSNILAFFKFLDLGIKTKLIINFSTISKFHLIEKKTVNENTTLTNESLLGITKSSLDQMLKFQKYPFINLLLPGIVTRDKIVNRPFIKNLIYNIKSNKNVDITNLNKPFNSFIDVYELFLFINFILESKKKIISGDYIFCPSGSTSLHKIIKYFKYFYNSKSKIINLGQNDKNYVLSNKKIKNNLNFKPSSIDELLTRLI